MSMGVQAMADERPADRRAAERRPSAVPAVLRHFKRGAEFIDLVDISTDGCGFTSRWPFEIGARVFLGLPGLETWAGRIAWYSERKGGVRFDRPLHPAVAGRYAAQIAQSRAPLAGLVPPSTN